MKPVQSISLAGRVYTLEKPAYEQLEAYLSNVQQILDHVEDAEEIVRDMEVRIGEKCDVYLDKNRQVIMVKEMKTILKEMGEPKAIGEEADLKDVHEKANIKRQLMRDVDDSIIGGVCAGIAHYISVRPLWVRTAFLLVPILFFPSLPFVTIGYLILYIIMPPAKTVFDKMQMYGEQYSLQEIAEQGKIPEALHQSKPFSLLERILMIPVRFIATVWAKTTSHIPLLQKLAGVLLIIVATGMLVVITILFVAGTFTNTHPQMKAALLDYPSQPLEYGAVVLGLIIITLPLIYLMILGFSLLKKRVIGGIWLFAVFISIWLVTFIGNGLVLTQVIPGIQKRADKEITESYTVEEFDAISTFIDGTYTIRTGDEYQVVMRGSQGVIRNLNPYVTERELKFGQIMGVDCFFCTNTQKPTIIITAPEVKRIGMSGEITAELLSYQGDNLELSLTEHVQLTATDLRVETLDIYQFGNPELILAGRADRTTADINTYAVLDGAAFTTREADISAHTSSDVVLTVEETATVTDIPYELGGSENSITIRGPADVIRKEPAESDMGNQYETPFHEK